MAASENSFDGLHQRMQSYVDNGDLAHVFSVIMRGTEVLDYHCAGYMDIESKAPLREDAIYRMFSSTKLLTAVAAMMLFEQGKFGLDDPLADYLPDFADIKVLVPGASAIDQVEDAKSPITIRQVLSHSAGFSYGFVDPTSVIDDAYLKNGLDLAQFTGDLADLVDRLATFPLAYQPGTSWAYSMASDVAAHLVEVISGERFEDFLQQHILEPLGMHDTGYTVAVEKLERVPAMYAVDDPADPSKGGLNPFSPAGDPACAEAPAFISGGGGLYSSVADYLTFLKLLANDGEWNGTRLLQAETLNLMRSNQLPEGVEVAFPQWAMAGTGFGLGFAVKQRLPEGAPAAAMGEYHWGGMAGTHSWLSPRAGITGFCGTQLMPGFWHPFSHEFKHLAYKLTAV